MMYQSHLLWSATVGMVAWPYAGPQDLESLKVFSIWMGVALVGGLLPDIDHPKSWIGKRIPILPSLIYQLSGHRGWTHSLFALLAYALLVGGVCWGLTRNVALSMLIGGGAAAGFGAHLAGDFITNRGVPLFWPVRARVGMPVCNTGGPAERSINIVLVLLCGWMIFEMGQPALERLVA